jgi:hypothetical protein
MLLAGERRASRSAHASGLERSIIMTAPAPPESQRLQTLRGVACVLLVAFHAIGNYPTSGLHVADDSGFRFFANLFQYIRMPLFTFLSGFVYAYRPVSPGLAGDLARRKLTRLLLPLLCVTTLYFAATSFAPSDSNGVIPLDQMWRIYIFPYVHYWFLQAIILIFALVAVLDRWRLLATPARYAVALSACLLVHLAVDMKRADDVPFGALYAMHFALYFVLGLGANRFRSGFCARAYRGRVCRSCWWQWFCTRATCWTAHIRAAMARFWKWRSPQRPLWRWFGCFLRSGRCKSSAPIHSRSTCFIRSSSRLYGSRRSRSGC